MAENPRTTLSDGTQVYPKHRNLKPNGQQEGYVVLAEEERAKGFVRPVRHSYKHLKCRGVTTMGQTIAELRAGKHGENPEYWSRERNHQPSLTPKPEGKRAKK